MTKNGMDYNAVVITMLMRYTMAMAQRMRIEAHAILLIIIAIIIAAVVVINLVFGRINRVSHAQDEAGNIHALFVLEDGEQLVSAQFLILNIRTQQMALLDLPPYLGVVIDSSDNLDRIDTLISENDFDAYINEVESLTEQEIDMYLRVGVHDFTRLVDLLEGVRVLLISSPNDEQTLPLGDVILDGYKVQEYIDIYRASEDPRVEIEGLQTIIRRTLLTIAEKTDYVRNDDVLDYIRRMVKTNLYKNELSIFLTDILANVDEEGVQTWFVQGDIRSVVVEDRRELLLFPDLNGRWITKTIAQIESQLVNARAFGANGNTISIQILNGTTTNGLARRTKLLYEQFGYAVVNIGNYQEQDVATTRMIGYGAPPETVQEVAAVIDISLEQVVQSIDGEESEYDFTLIIGDDFDGVSVR